MTDRAQIWERARSDLVLIPGHGQKDGLWEYCARVARSAERIAQVPEIASQNPDHIAILSAALYHEGGWVAAVRNGGVDIADLLTQPLTAAQRENGVLLMQRGLGNLVASSCLERASVCIRHTAAESDGPVEAKVVSDAVALEEFGTLSLWPMIRRHGAEGKGVQAVIDKMRTRSTYKYWPPRLRDAFHFDVVRKIAEARLDAFERFVDELDAYQQGEDVIQHLSPPHATWVDG